MHQPQPQGPLDANGVPTFLPGGSSMLVQMGLANMQTFVEQHKAQLPWYMADTTHVRRYFEVTHEYVRVKLLRLIFPFRRGFQRSSGSFDDQGANADLYGPAQDPCAPDLYLPLMGLVTYVTLCAFGRGLTADSLSPSDLAGTATAGGVVIVMQALAERLWRYSVNIPATPLLDSVALFGYLFCSVAAAVLLRGIIEGSGLPTGLGWVAALYLLAAYAFFLYRSLMESFSRNGSVPARALPVVYAGAAVQIPLFVWFLRQAF
jgi:hypothetical protein